MDDETRIKRRVRTEEVLLDDLGGRLRPQIAAGASFSGHERNHFWLNAEGRFHDVSGVSGLDHPGDSRSFARLDFDHDGWPDVAQVNANAPWAQLFRNRIGERLGREARFVAVQLRGGNDSSSPRPGFAPRDGTGARIELELDGRTLVRELRCGEGFAAVNSATTLIGLGEAERAERLRVLWPSGREQVLEDVASGTLLRVHEDPAQAPGGEAFQRLPYEPVALPARAEATAPAAVLPEVGTSAQSRAPLRLYTTMATWCASCKRELPRLAALRDHFGERQLALYGVPVDPEDDAARLGAYQQEFRPVYELLASLDEAQKAAVSDTVRLVLDGEALPASVLTDTGGRILHAQWGVPSVSELRALCAKLQSR